MRKILVLCVIFISIAVPVYAANTVLSFTDQLINSPYATGVQTEAANPLLTQLISDNFSHTLTLSSIQTSAIVPIVYISLVFNGTNSGCIVRPMYTTTKASYLAYPVSAGGGWGMAVHPNFKFFNYSSCYN